MDLGIAILGAGVAILFFCGVPMAISVVVGYFNKKENQRKYGKS